MTIRGLKGKVMENIPVQTVLLSVSDKQGLDTLVSGLLEINPKVLLLSTGGTYRAMKERLDERFGENLLEVAEYTGFKEMDGGLVKTLNPAIHGGILGERNNPLHQEYLRDMNASYIDLVVGNLYPFEEVLKKIERGDIDVRTGEPFNFESARGNIDIGGPTMVRGAAKNFPGCAVLCEPSDYQRFLESVSGNDGCTTFGQRKALAGKVFGMTGRYDLAIEAYLDAPENDAEAIRPIYKFSDGEAA